MRKIYLLPFLLSTLISTAFATNNPTLDKINMNIQNVLESFQNNTTLAKINFDKLKMNSDRALKVAFNSHAQKIGANNIIDLKIKNLEYNYNKGLNPQILFSGSFGFDFTKVKTPQEINEAIEDAIKELNNTPTTPYGDALKIKSTISAIEKDDNDNKIGFTAIISAKIDFNKLPTDTSKEDIDFKKMTFAVSVNAKTSSEMHGHINLNPDAKSFKDGQEELKQTLEMLIDNDQNLMMAIAYIAGQIDEVATDLLSGNLFNKNIFKKLFSLSLSRRL